jgi:hypothetical protein
MMRRGLDKAGVAQAKLQCMILSQRPLVTFTRSNHATPRIMMITALQKQALEPIVPSTVSLTSNPNRP